MSRAYCSYFDHRYAARAVAMVRSLRRFEPDAVFYVLCLDEPVVALLGKLDLPNLHLIRLTDFEAFDPELAASRGDGRSLVEYYFSMTASLVRYVFHAAPDAEWVTYLDGDLWFFGPPEVIYAEASERSIVLIPHRFPAGLESKKQYGRYNVGWVGFRRSKEGEGGVAWWRERCIEWCRDYVDEANQRFADQRYLDRVPDLFKEACVIANPGANLAPWNIGGHTLAWTGEVVTVDGSALIFFHFHGLKRLSSHRFMTSHAEYNTGLNVIARCYVYRPYLGALLAVEAEIAPHLQKIEGEMIRTPGVKAPRAPNSVRKWKQRLRGYIALARGLTVRVPGR